MITPPLYILGIDGSTNTVGVSLYRYQDRALLLEKTQLIDVTRVDDHWEPYLEKFGGLSCRIARIEVALREVFNTHQINSVFYEQHFINPRRPTSVIPLARSQQMVERVCMDYGIGIEYIPPQLMKKHLGVTLKGATKEDVKANVIRLVNEGCITVSPFVADLETLSEHEIDAIGIVYAKCIEDGLLGEETPIFINQKKKRK